MCEETTGHDRLIVRVTGASALRDRVGKPFQIEWHAEYDNPPHRRDFVRSFGIWRKADLSYAIPSDWFVQSIRSPAFARAGNL